MLANAVALVGGEVGAGRALHMLCKVSLLPLLVSAFACNFFKLKRASRSHAKTGFFVGSKSMAEFCFRDIRGKRGSPVRGSVQASFRGTFRSTFWKLFSESFWNLLGVLGPPLGDFW